MKMFDESIIKPWCDKYKIKCIVFPKTNTMLLDTGLDEWQVRFTDNKFKPYCLLHKNTRKNINKHHTQRKLKDLDHVFHAVVTHKGVLTGVYGLSAYCNSDRIKGRKNKRYTCN